MKTERKRQKGSVFEWTGRPSFGQALPLALQHIVAMIVGCVTPAIIIAGVAGLNQADKVILVQAVLVTSAIGTAVQLFPIGKKQGLRIGAGVPLIMGAGFAYVTSMSTVVEGYGISSIFGAEIVGGMVAILIALSFHKIRKLFPPLIIGTVVFCIGLTLYPIAIRYMAGGSGSVTYGNWKNWLIALLTFAVVIICNNFGKGIVKLASVLIGIVVGYIISWCCGMVDLSAVASAGILQLPKFMYFGIDFELTSCVAIGLLFAINSIQAMGDTSATVTGSMDRQPTDDELRGGIMGFGVGNVIGAFFGGIPSVSFSQNVGIITTTKVINRCVIGLAACLMGIAGLVPKFSALLTSIPQCVLGGATLTVFASITFTGIKMIAAEGLTVRNGAIVGPAVALGVGVTQAADSLAAFPGWVSIVFGKAPVVLAVIIAITLNLVLPKERKEE